MVKKKCSLHLYFSRILLSYAVLLKSRIYFLPVLDMTGKRSRGDFQLCTLRKAPGSHGSDWHQGVGRTPMTRFSICIVKFRHRDHPPSPACVLLLSPVFRGGAHQIWPFDPKLRVLPVVGVQAGLRCEWRQMFAPSTSPFASSAPGRATPVTYCRTLSSHL